MHSVTHALEVDASEGAVWKILSDLEGVAAWNPNVESARLVGAQRRGVGASRESDLTDGNGFLQERVVDWSEGKWLTTEVVGSSLPLSTAKIMLGVEPCSAGRSTVVVVMEYEPRTDGLRGFGARLALRGKLCRASHRMLQGLKTAAEGAVARPATLRPVRA
jgi:hypothetical protein